MAINKKSLKYKRVRKYVIYNAGKRSTSEMASNQGVSTWYIGQVAKAVKKSLVVKEEDEIPGFDEIQRMAYCMAWR